MTKFPSFLHPIPYPYILPSPKVLCKPRAVCSLQLELILIWLQGSCVTRKFVGDNLILILQISHENSLFPNKIQILFNASMKQV